MMAAFNFSPAFESDIVAGVKRSTIRKSMRCKIGDNLQFYTGQRTKECRKIGSGVCIGIAQIAINLPDGTPWAVTGRIGEVFVAKRLANQEGFINEKLMCDFFREKYGDIQFNGFMHVWEQSDEWKAKDAEIERLKQPYRGHARNGQPVAMRHSWDGHGWDYIDSGAGSDWQTRYPDSEPLFTRAMEE